jgi:hypothetical protein
MGARPSSGMNSAPLGILLSESGIFREVIACQGTLCVE